MRDVYLSLAVACGILGVYGIGHAAAYGSIPSAAFGFACVFSGIWSLVTSWET